MLTCERVEKQTEMDAEEKSKYYSEKKKKVIGNVHFLAELAQKKVLASKVIKMCTYEIVEKFMREYAEFKQNLIQQPLHEHTLEAILELYKRVGKNMDTAKEKADSGKSENLRDDVRMMFTNLPKYLVEAEARKAKAALQEQKGEQKVEPKAIDADNLFQVLSVIRTEGDISERVRLLIKNLEEKRKGGWVENETTKTEGPLKISELHQKIQQEQEDQEMLGEQYRREQRGMNPSSYRSKPQPYAGGRGERQGDLCKLGLDVCVMTL
jgi:hypothetical protein